MIIYPLHDKLKLSLTCTLGEVPLNFVNMHSILSSCDLVLCNSYLWNPAVEKLTQENVFWCDAMLLNNKMDESWMGFCGRNRTGNPDCMLPTRFREKAFGYLQNKLLDFWELMRLSEIRRIKNTLTEMIWWVKGILAIFALKNICSLYPIFKWDKIPCMHTESVPP